MRDAKQEAEKFAADYELKNDIYDDLSYMLVSAESMRRLREELAKAYEAGYSAARRAMMADSEEATHG